MTGSLNNYVTTCLLCFPKPAVLQDFLYLPGIRQAIVSKTVLESILLFNCSNTLKMLDSLISCNLFKLPGLDIYENLPITVAHLGVACGLDFFSISSIKCQIKIWFCTVTWYCNSPINRYFLSIIFFSPGKNYIIHIIEMKIFKENQKTQEFIMGWLFFTRTLPDSTER